MRSEQQGRAERLATYVTCLPGHVPVPETAIADKAVCAQFVQEHYGVMKDDDLLRCIDALTLGDRELRAAFRCFCTREKLTTAVTKLVVHGTM